MILHEKNGRRTFRRVIDHTIKIKNLSKSSLKGREYVNQINTILLFTQYLKRSSVLVRSWACIYVLWITFNVSISSKPVRTAPRESSKSGSPSWVCRSETDWRLFSAVFQALNSYAKSPRPCVGPRRRRGGRCKCSVGRGVNCCRVLPPRPTGAKAPWTSFGEARIAFAVAGAGAVVFTARPPSLPPSMEQLPPPPTKPEIRRFWHLRHLSKRDRILEDYEGGNMKPEVFIIDQPRLTLVNALQNDALEKSFLKLATVSKRNQDLNIIADLAI